MRKLLSNFCRDQRGYVAATEWMLVVSILTLGSLAALWSMHLQP